MKIVFYIFFIICLSQTAVIFRKKAFNKFPSLDIYTSIWIIYGVNFIMATLSMLYFKGTKISSEWIKTENIGSIKWLLVAAFFGFVYSVLIMPLIKDLNVSYLSTIKGPLSMLVVVLASLFFLKEKPTWNTYISIPLFALSALVAGMK